MKKDFFEIFGNKTLEFIEELGNMSMLAWNAITSIYKGKIHIVNTYYQMVRIGIESIPVALITAFFVGMVFAIQIATEFTRFGAGKMVGGIMAIAVARELAPVLTAVVLAGRIGASIAAEIGTMKVTQQLDAMETLGTNPLRYLMVPRMIASAVMFPVLTIFCDIVGFAGAFLVSVFVAQINSYGFIETTNQFLKIGDVFGGIFKACVFGILITIIACYKGLNAKNGAKGVGEATTGAVVFSLIAIFITNYFMSMALFK